MKKYFPIKIFSINLGYGWWWGTYFFFFKKKAFAIIPCWLHLHNCEYMNGNAIEDGATHSWHPDRQREKEEDSKN